MRMNRHPARNEAQDRGKPHPPGALHRGALLGGFMALVLGGSMLLETSCSTTRTRDEWLRVFFDGVPVEEEEAAAVEAGTAEESEREAMPPLIPVRAAPTVFVHDPFAEGMCDECHQQNMSQGFTEPPPGMCYECHDDYTDMGTTVHSPVEEGECLVCHNPHNSKFEGLLTAAPRSVCFECHDEEDMVEVEAHLDTEDQTCTACHDPHQGDKEYYLK